MGAEDSVLAGGSSIIFSILLNKNEYSLVSFEEMIFCKCFAFRSFFYSSSNSLSNQESEESFLTAPVLERQTSAEVRLGSGETIGIPLNTKKVHIFKKGQVYPKALEPEIVEKHGDIETTARRTVIGLEPLEGLLDEFPDSIKETIVSVIGSE